MVIMIKPKSKPETTLVGHEVVATFDCADTRVTATTPDAANAHLLSAYSVLEAAKVTYEVAEAELEAAISYLKDALEDSASDGTGSAL